MYHIMYHTSVHILFVSAVVHEHELDPKTKWVFGSGWWTKHNMDF